MKAGLFTNERLRSMDAAGPDARAPLRPSRHPRSHLIRNGLWWRRDWFKAPYCGNKWRRGTARASASAKNTLGLGRDEPRSKRARSVSESPAQVASSAWLMPRSRRASCRRCPTCWFTTSRLCCRSTCSTRSTAESAGCGRCATVWRICTGWNLSAVRLACRFCWEIFVGATPNCIETVVFRRFLAAFLAWLGQEAATGPAIPLINLKLHITIP